MSSYQKSNIHLIDSVLLIMIVSGIVQYLKGGRDESDFTIELEGSLSVSTLIKPLHQVGGDSH